MRRIKDFINNNDIESIFIQKNVLPEFSKNELKNVLTEIYESFKTKGDPNEIYKKLVLCILADEDKTFRYIQKKGMFRYSKWVDYDAILPKVIELMAFDIDKFSFNEERKTYILSLFRIRFFDKVYKNIIATIEKFINDHPDRIEERAGNKATISLGKTLLCYAENAFLQQKVSSAMLNQKYSRIIIKENIADAISFLLFQYSKICSFS